MNYSNNKVSDIQIAYIGGGSRGWAWTFMTDLALDDQISGTIRLYDIDRQAAENNAVIGNHLMSREDAKGDWKFEVKDSLQDVLTGCDFAVISILPGTFDEMASDVHLPERLGIYQSVGDTAGPGGMIRALRTIPMFVEIAEAIRDYAPDCWVINYTNPMSLCVKTLYHVFPEIKAFGCCHEVFGTQKVLKGIYEAETGNTIEDCYELEGENWMNSSFKCAHRVKMDLFNRFGLIAAAGDRHLAEFMPGNEYLNDPETVHSWKFGLTTVDWRKNDLQKRLERSHRLANAEEEVTLEPTGEEGILLIKALCGLDRFVSNVNIPNTALQIPNLPANALVETNALFDLDSIHPVAAGALSEDVKALIMPHVENHERILKAALTCDEELVVTAFMNDPIVKGKNPSEQEIRELVHDMLVNTKAYLPEGWKL